VAKTGPTVKKTGGYYLAACEKTLSESFDELRTNGRVLQEWEKPVHANPRASFFQQGEMNEKRRKKVWAKNKRAPFLLGALLRRQRAEVVQLMFFVPCR
jgi:hypothetical protein